MPRTSKIRSVMGVVAVVAFAGLTACANRDRYPGYNTVASDVTPDMLSLHSRPIDAANLVAISTNENWRMFWADMGRASLLNRPSLLSPTPMPH